MFKKTKSTALVLAATLAITTAACADTSYAMTIDGKTVAAGEFIMAQISTSDEAKEKFIEEYPDVDTNREIFDYYEYTLEGIPFRDWYNTKALEKVKLSLAYEKEFERLGLEIDSKQISDLKANIRAFWDQESEDYRQGRVKEKTHGEYFEKRGVGEASFINTQIGFLKAERVFHAYYDEEGEYEVSERELMQVFEEDYLRGRVMRMQKRDVNGQELTDEELEALRERASRYVDELNGGAAFNSLQNEYNDFLEQESRRLNPEDYYEEEGEEIVLDEFEINVGLDDEEDAGDLDIETFADNDSDINLDLLDEASQQEELFSRDYAIYEEELNERLFGLSDNEADMIETDEEIIVFQRLDITKRVDWLEEMKENVLHQLKDDEIKDRMIEITEGFVVVFNQDAMRRYEPKKVID